MTGHVVGGYPDSREVFTASVPDAAADAISRVINKHAEEFDAALAPYGLSIEVILQPSWQYMVNPSTLILGGTVEEKRDAIARLIAKVNEEEREAARQRALRAWFGDAQ